MNDIPAWETVIPVRSYELDFAGIVNNAVYLNYLEEARLDLLRQCNFDFFAMTKEGVLPVIAKATIEYKSPARGNDVLIVKGTIPKIGKTSLLMQYEIRSRNDDRLVAQAETLMVFVNEKGRPTAIPEKLIAAIQP
ncbi:MAG: acyl-CoA thioesterase [candidate division KSB1 bacterium]|nr:acyl-CoA thioesterase [candidate division KSB1 bacterium]MDZ7302581.1 acyl-CoA thioesterase [candidate division KSB1 bacterium]MDZ7311578.1 acyl-CoA thioesterase [candidate division KSB1 bacterium]